MKEKVLFQLGKRLGLCAAMVRPGCRLADIGTDHGYLPVWLVKTGAIHSAIAADVREGPLQSARQNVERYGVEEQVDPRLSDGLDGIAAQEVDDVVMAGMGGELIARLIDRAVWLRDPKKHLILQPMTSAEDLRAFLVRKGFGVFREEAVQEDGHIYSAMLVWYDPSRASRNETDPSFLYRGLVDGSTPSGKAYLLNRAASLRKRVNGLRHTGKLAQADQLEVLCARMEQEAEKGEVPMTKVQDIYQWIDTWAPFSTAMSFDNAGLLVGSGEEEVQTVLLALDITSDVVKEAEKVGAQLILSHHPVIFDPLKRLTPGSAPWLLAHHGIAAICAHTNLDLAPGGVNSCLAACLGLENSRTLSVDPPSGLPESLCGELPSPMQPREFARYVKETLGCERVEYTEGSAPVHTVGLCSGAGAFCMPDPAVSGVQAFVTGEAKHHELLAAEAMGLTLVVAGHYHTEAVVLPELQKRLSQAFPHVAFSIAAASRTPSHAV